MSWVAIAVGGSIAISAAGTAMSVIGQAKQGADAYKAAFKQANNVIIESRFRINDVARTRLLTRATQKAAYAAQGVKIEGSPLELLAETNYLANIDKARIEYQAAASAAEIRSGGDAAFTSSRYAMGGTVLGGIGNVASAGVGGYKIGKVIGG